MDAPSKEGTHFIVWVIFLCITVFLFAYFLVTPARNWGGDIIEYYGTSESLMNHLTPQLTTQDVKNITHKLNPAYLQDPQYYIQGIDGGRYPVHFIGYSLLLIPLRIILRLFQQDEVRSLTLINVTLLSLFVFYILRKHIHDFRKQSLFLLVVYLSPLISFLSWPGPEILYVTLIFTCIFLYFEKKYAPATLVAAFASWQSQPLLVIAIGLLIYYLFHVYWMKKENDTSLNYFKIFNVITSVLLVLALPYLYNLTVFGVWSPWTRFQNVWTQYYGFGLHNISLFKLFEQFFDLNMGLFWYAPVIVTIGMVSGCMMIVKKNTHAFFLLLFILTAFFYQTNPAWHYGTAGYGPTRHILFFLPLFVYFFMQYRFKSIQRTSILLFILVITQGYIHYFNGFLSPNLLNVLRHSPFATYMLTNYPALYSPTPEIFIDRTNHTDLDRPTTAIYRINDVCRKAYVLVKDKEEIINECGFIPKQYEKLFKQDQNYPFEGYYINY